jgi:hypothetical protein
MIIEIDMRNVLWLIYLIRFINDSVNLFNSL